MKYKGCVTRLLAYRPHERARGTIMATEQNHTTENDLDKTDRLPILDGTLFDHDVEDDAVRMDHTAVLPGHPLAAAPHPAETEFVRPPGVDLPSLAESVRSVEERIARQNAEY